MGQAVYMGKKKKKLTKLVALCQNGTLGKHVFQSCVLC